MLESALTLGWTHGLVTVLIGLCVWLFTSRPKGIPPGPFFTIPIIGNFAQIGNDPLKSFREMRKKYGDVFSVYFANRLVIVINGFDNIKEAFIKNGDVFNERPHLGFNDLVGHNGKGIAQANGETWREQRKFAINTLKEFGMGRNILEEKVLKEVDAFMEALSKNSGKAMDVSDLIQMSVSNIICQMVFGYRFEYTDPKYIKTMNTIDEVVRLPVLGQFIPLLRFIPGDPFKIHHTVNSINTMKQETTDPSIEEHLRLYDKQNINDFISAYIKEMKLKASLGKYNTSMDRSNLYVTINDLLFGGTETSSTAIKWLLLYFLYFPEVQDKCFAEIINKVGLKGPICFNDRTKLPFVEATIMETLRVSDLLPVSIPYSMGKDTYFKGYLLPKDALVLPMLGSVLSDPEIWGDPENFRPERFIDEDGNVTTPEAYIPFSIGRRRCLGEPLAKMELFLFLSNIIQRFKFVKVEGSQLPSLEGIFGVAHYPGHFQIRALLRT